MIRIIQIDIYTSRAHHALLCAVLAPLLVRLMVPPLARAAACTAARAAALLRRCYSAPLLDPLLTRRARFARAVAVLCTAAHAVAVTPRGHTCCVSAHCSALTPSLLRLRCLLARAVCSLRSLSRSLPPSAPSTARWWLSPSCAASASSHRPELLVDHVDRARLHDCPRLCRTPARPHLRSASHDSCQACAIAVELALEPADLLRKKLQ